MLIAAFSHHLLIVRLSIGIAAGEPASHRSAHGRARHTLLAASASPSKLSQFARPQKHEAQEFACSICKHRFMYMCSACIACRRAMRACCRTLGRSGSQPRACSRTLGRTLAAFRPRCCRDATLRRTRAPTPRRTQRLGLVWGRGMLGAVQQRPWRPPAPR